MAGCGGYNPPTAPTATPGVASAKKRAFVVNQFGSAIDVVDSQNDLTTPSVLSVNFSPDSILVLSAKKKSLVHSTNGAEVLIDNPTETVQGTVNSFPGPSESILATPDSLFAYAAIPSLGKVYKMDLTTQAETAIPADPALLPGVRRIAITHNGNTILTFSDNNNTVSFIDRTSSDAVSAPLAGFDRPYTAVFSSDDATAYVLNCGAECGGVAASIAVVNMSTKTITNTFHVRAATVAVTDSTNLYVAGTDPATNLGRLDVMNLSSFAVTPVATAISDGLHTTMALAANNKLYIGSKACSNSGGQCLSVYNTSSGSAAILTGNSTYPAVGDVTAITPIVGRSVVYVVQNGLLVIYDTATDAPQATQLTLIGKVVDVKEVDN